MESRALENRGWRQFAPCPISLAIWLDLIILLHPLALAYSICFRGPREEPSSTDLSLLHLMFISTLKGKLTRRGSTSELGHPLDRIVFAPLDVHLPLGGIDQKTFYFRIGHARARAEGLCPFDYFRTISRLFQKGCAKRPTQRGTLV